MTGGWPLWRTQLATLVRVELHRSLASRRALAPIILVALPVLVAGLRALFMSDAERANPAAGIAEFAGVFHFFVLRFVVFFGCAHLFVRAFRGEILEQSLHYTLLAPLRRSVLVGGKYLGALTAAIVLFGGTTCITWLLYVLPHPASLAAAPWGHLARYLLVVVFACAAYGALFLLAGLFFRNPTVPAVLFLGWEVLTPFLPAALKRISVVHYLASLRPVPVAEGPFALLAQPVTAWAAAFALLLGSAVLTTLAVWKAARLEVTYSTDE